MPLNGPIQADGQELKAAHTQKPLGSREGSPVVCPREGKPSHHKEQCEDVSASSMASSGRQPHTTPPHLDSNRGWHYAEKAAIAEVRNENPTNNK